MKKKQKFMSFFLFLCLIFSLSTLVSAKWQTEADGSRYYTVNGQKVSGNLIRPIEGTKEYNVEIVMG